MFMFGPMIAKNARSGRLLGGAPITVTTLDGVTLDTYTVWWRAAAQRAAYTALAALLPLAALLVSGEVTVLYTISLVALAGLASFATSLAGLPEAAGKVVPWWRAVTVRVLKTAGQVAAPVLGSAVLLDDVGWYELGVAVGGAALATLIRTLMAYLPEDAAGAQELERIKPHHRAGPAAGASSASLPED